MGIPQPGKMDVTLVAFYGDKPPQIAELIRGATNQLNDLLGKKFVPYCLPQVHSTIIGLEGRRAGKHIINANYTNLCNQTCPMDLKAALQILKETTLLPFDVTIGGFIDGGPYSFTSRNVVPYLRSFSVQGQYAVAMGWPYSNGNYAKSVNQLRRAFNAANILHKYHSAPYAEDNDFFFVLGNISKTDIDPILLLEAQGRLRAFFAAHEPVTVTISRSCLRVVGYVDEKLTPETSYSCTLDEAEKNIDQILSLYRDAFTEKK